MRSGGKSTKKKRAAFRGVYGRLRRGPWGIGVEVHTSLGGVLVVLKIHDKYDIYGEGEGGLYGK